MKRLFEENLNAYKHNISEASVQESSDAESFFSDWAKQRGTDTKTQEEIYELVFVS